jgi:hypothetical protein
MQKMTQEEYRQFIQAGTRTGKLATVRQNGQPHVVPIWFTLDGETIVFVTGARSVKGRNIQRDPRVSLCIDEEVPPYSFVMLEGIASISTDPDEMLTWATRIGGRYMGAELAEAYGKRNATPETLLIRVTPTKIVAERNIAD